ncbi:MAG TPA: hypothetical protein VMG30_01375 [Acidobacteriota bacterium]|nr:hypothetical protein [Acidobacteriota bacterium]
MGMCAEIIEREIIPGPRHGGPSVYLSIFPDLSKLWERGCLDTLIAKLLDHISTICHPARSIRVAVREKKRMCDLEQFFSVFPDRWVDLSFECQSLSGLEMGVQGVLESLGYSCREWVGVEGSESQLGAFHLGAHETPALILYMQNHGARRNCDILIPEFQG